ncbi:MAG: hypothetical protein AB8G11_15280 [Saprospiraceae bacterium]
MKNLLLGFLLAFLFLQSCNDDNVIIPTCENCNFTCLDVIDSTVFTNDCLDNYECTYKVFAQSEIDIDVSQGFGSGDKNVFQMVTQTEGDPMIADDEYTNSLVFELDESQNSFSVDGSALSDMNVHFKRSCFCSEVEFKPIAVGCLQGEQQTDGSWFVQGNLTVSYSWGDFDVKVDAQFIN